MCVRMLLPRSQGARAMATARPMREAVAGKPFALLHA